MYQHNWAETADLSDSASNFASWMEGVIQDAITQNNRLGASWQSDAAGQFIGQTLKQAMAKCEHVYTATASYGKAVARAGELASHAERKAHQIVSNV